jgi:hypothetical protein
MMFWDASALIPLMLEGPQSRSMRSLARKDAAFVVWWGSPVECCSAFGRLRRESILTTNEEDRLRRLLSTLVDAWTEIQPGQLVRERAQTLLLSHTLRAADSLQLAAAVLWAGHKPAGHRFVCLDQRLRSAARNEGFSIVPEDLS